MTKSIVGCLFDNLPPYALDPPIEAVVFGWGVSEDGQLVGSLTECWQHVLSPSRPARRRSFHPYLT